MKNKGVTGTGMVENLMILFLLMSVWFIASHSLSHNQLESYLNI